MEVINNKFGALFLCACLQATGSFVMKLSAEKAKGQYNHLSVPVVAECLKLAITVCFLLLRSEAVKMHQMHHYACLAVLYAVINVCWVWAHNFVNSTTILMLANWKIVFTALAHRVILSRRPTIRKLASLIVLIISCLAAQLPCAAPSGHALGIMLVIIVCACSGIATVYNEWALKSSTLSMHQQNFLIYTAGIACYLVTAPFVGVSPYNLLAHFNEFTWLSVLLYSISGLLTSWMLMNIDSFLKVFTGSVAIPIASIISLLQGNDWDHRVTLGTTGIIVAMFLHYSPPELVDMEVC